MIWKRPKKPTPEEEREFEDRMKEARSSAKDVFAMIFSAFLVLVLPSLLILLAVAFLMMLLFGAI